MIKILPVILLIIFITGCQSVSSKKSFSELEAQRFQKSLNELKQHLGQTDEATRRVNGINELHKEFQALQADLEQAISFSIKLQTDDFQKKRKWSTFGSFMGLVATTLNTASRANIVTSTAFTGLQTLALSRVTDSDVQVIHPQSYQQMQDSRKELEDLYIKFKANHELLMNPNLDKDQWNALFFSTRLIFSEMRIKMAGILPPDKYTDKSKGLNSKL
ncbi:hypothetical protein ABFY41_11295 [Acinetobacter haemolyticus]|uniref:hypothetical protein n=1 Tax=Acinetobacter haemolyticus TaxID=29430 RepID=UPI003D23FD65